MAKKDKKKGYPWKFASVGGSVRVDIRSGNDIAHLGELDKKLWTVLSCPVNGLEFDPKTLACLDSNGDGKIRVNEVMEAAAWLTRVIRDSDLILKGDAVLPLSAFNTDDEEGAKLLASAKQILSNLGLEKDEISTDDTADTVKIFADTKFNGDGLITQASAGDDELKDLIVKISELIGKGVDRSGADGVSADHIEAFYAAAADYAAWKDAGDADASNVFPFGEDTAAAYDACNALKDKAADYFMRCKLIGFDEAVAGAVDVSVEKIEAISGGDLGAADTEIATYPLARPGVEAVLPLDKGVNPAWKGAVAAVKALVLDKEYPGKESITEDEWNAVLSKFVPYAGWLAAKKGAEVESLGTETVKAILKADRKADLLSLVDSDKALEDEALSIEAVCRLTYLYRDFKKFLDNYVVFKDFYDKDTKLSAIFQAGRLFIDQRSTDLCVKIADMGKVADFAGHSGMFILICVCNSKVKAATMNIAAVLTGGDVNSLRPGQNAVFYDRDGVDWDATVVHIIDNPISIRQAFWAPYRKVGRWISDKVNKSAGDKNDKLLGNATAAADAAPDAAGGVAAVKSSFDIAKFAGIFAALGMGLGLLGSALASLVKGAVNLGLWKVLLVILAIMLVISAPSMFLAWRKLRKRNLGPLLNANGWAINAGSLVNVKFGRTLTSLAKYPKLSKVDAKARRRARIRCAILSLLALLVAGGLFMFFTDRLSCIGLPFHKEEPVEEVVEAVEEEAVETAETVEAEVSGETPQE